ncbi:hypothetical protein ACQ4M4_17355 [Leptolyngbya sp. AN02str]
MNRNKRSQVLEVPPIPATTIQNSQDFDQWAIAVRQQMIASLRKRGVRF